MNYYVGDVPGGLCSGDSSMSSALEVRAVPINAALNLRTTTLQKLQRVRGGLLFEAHVLCVSLNSRLESHKEEEQEEEEELEIPLSDRLACVNLIDLSLKYLMTCCY